MMSFLRRPHLMLKKFQVKRADEIIAEGVSALAQFRSLGSKWK